MAWNLTSLKSSSSYPELSRRIPKLNRFGLHTLALTKIDPPIFI